jgi:hypothetical protein
MIAGAPPWIGTLFSLVPGEERDPLTAFDRRCALDTARANARRDLP